MEEIIGTDEIINESVSDEIINESVADEHYQNKEKLMQYIQNLLDILETKQNDGDLNMLEAHTCYEAYLNINDLIKII